ncbi:MAG: DUF434 domain-containing protein [Pirellulales bacterium]|nr:DUF434 domain-containing protein [Pirellulales bacterium]
MPDRRTHRGPHTLDRRLFGADAIARLRAATGELSWLLARGYPPDASLKLVGDRHRLVARQRTAVARSACGDRQAADRQSRRMGSDAIRGQVLRLDGYNVLTTVEAALAGGVVLAARDGCLRDMASMHGSYRKVAETLPALERIGQKLSEAGPAECLWYLDRPVSNSGRLRAIVEDLAAARGWPWRVELVADPDAILSRPGPPVATADSVILDRCGPWVNLVREILAEEPANVWLVDLAADVSNATNTPAHPRKA